MERLLMAGHCGKAVSPSVFPEHVEGLRSKVRSFVVTSPRQSGTELHRESKKGCHPNHGYNFVNS